MLLSKGKDLDITGETELVRRLDEIRKQNHLDTMEDLEKAAASQGVSYEDFKQNIRNGIITQQVIRDEVGRHIQMTQAELQKYYQQHLSDFTQPESVRLSEILVPVQTGGDEAANLAAAKAKADDLDAKIKGGAQLCRPGEGKLRWIYRGAGRRSRHMDAWKAGKAAGGCDLRAAGGAVDGADSYSAGLRDLEGHRAYTGRHAAAGFRQAAGGRGGLHVRNAAEAARVSGQAASRTPTSMCVPAMRIRRRCTTLRSRSIAPTRRPDRRRRCTSSAAATPGAHRGRHAGEAAAETATNTPGTTAATGTTATGTATAAAVDGSATKTTASGTTTAVANAPTPAVEKPGKKEKIRFGQSPREALPPAAHPTNGSEEAAGQAAGAEAGAGNEAQVASNSGSTDIPGSETAAPVESKTRYSYRARQPKPKKVKTPDQVENERAAQPDTPEETAAQKTQSAPLGLAGDTAAKKKAPKAKGEKTRYSDEINKSKEAAPPPPQTSTPSPLATPGTVPATTGNAPADNATPTQQGGSTPAGAQAPPAQPQQ